MNEKVEELRWLIAHRADQIWDDLIKIDPMFIPMYDRVKVALENMIEQNYMVPNMWEPEFIRTLALTNVKWLLSKVEAEEMAYMLGREICPQ